MNVVLLIVFAVAGLGLGVLYNMLVIKNFPDNIRKGSYVKSVIVFFIVTLVFFGLVTARNIAYENVKKHSSELQRYVTENHSNLEFVRRGINMSGIGDPARVNQVVAEIRSVFPSHTDLGIPKLIYDMAADAVTSELQKRLVAANAAKNFFTDENNVLSISSIVNGIQRIIMNIINVILLIIAIIVFILFAKFIISSLIAASKAKKARVNTINNADTGTGDINE
jgi:small-conductance mechanosensitive channel